MPPESTLPYSSKRYRLAGPLPRPFEIELAGGLHNTLLPAKLKSTVIFF